MGSPGVALAIISIVLSLLAAYIEYQEAQKLQRDIDSMLADEDVGQKIKANTRGTSEPIKVIYGRHRTGANNVYLSTAGDENNDLYYAHTLCEGPIQGIVMRGVVNNAPTQIGPDDDFAFLDWDKWNLLIHQNAEPEIDSGELVLPVGPSITAGEKIVMESRFSGNNGEDFYAEIDIDWGVGTQERAYGRIILCDETKAYGIDIGYSHYDGGDIWIRGHYRDYSGQHNSGNLAVTHDYTKIRVYRYYDAGICWVGGRIYNSNTALWTNMFYGKTGVTDSAIRMTHGEFDSPCYYQIFAEKQLLLADAYIDWKLDNYTVTSDWDNLTYDGPQPGDADGTYYFNGSPVARDPDDDFTGTDDDPPDTQKWSMTGDSDYIIKSNQLYNYATTGQDSYLEAKWEFDDDTQIDMQLALPLFDYVGDAISGSIYLEDDTGQMIVLRRIMDGSESIKGYSYNGSSWTNRGTVVMTADYDNGGMRITRDGSDTWRLLAWNSNTSSWYQLSSFVFNMSGAVRLTLRSYVSGSGTSCEFGYDDFVVTTGTISWDDPEWVNEANAVDGDVDTYARTDSYSGDPNTYYLRSNSNTCIGTDLGTIAKVELRVKGYTLDGSSVGNLQLKPIYDGVEGPFTTVSDLPTSLVRSGISGSVDITRLPGSPSEWTWEDVQNIDVVMEGTIDSPATSPNDVIYISMIQVIVTFGDPMIWFGDKLIFEHYDGYYNYDVKPGNSYQVQDTLINEAISNFTDPMHYTAYIAWHLTYNEDLFRGIPIITYLIDGRILYNFVDDTTEWSDNPVLALYDFFTNSRYGLGLSSSIIDIDTWTDAYQYCIDKNFTINMCVNVTENSIWDVINNIMNLFRGSLNYWGGQYYLKFRDLNYESSVFTIEDKHIYQDTAGKAAIILTDPGYYNMARGIKVSFINAENDLYVQDSFTIGDVDGVVSNFNLVGSTDRETIGILATSQLEREQLNRTVSGRFRDDCVYLEPNDIVTFNSSSLSIEDQIMRVLSSTYSAAGFIDLILQYEDEAIYNDVYDINPQNQYQTTTPNPSVPSLINDPSVVEVTYDYRMRSYSRLDVSFSIDADSWFDHCEVWISTNGDVEANYKNQMTVTDSFSIDPAQEGATYFIILRTVNKFGTKQALGAASKLSITVIGRSQTPPASITYLDAIVGNGSVSLRSTSLQDPDIELYEFRVGSDWSSSIFLSSKRSPVEELTLVIPGSHTFWCNTKGTNGLYGLYPQSVSVTVPIQTGWSLDDTFTDDYTDSSAGQVFINTEHLIYSADDYLKCSHDLDYEDSTAVSSFLSGQYISEEFDLGVAAASHYVFVETEFVTIGSGSTWDDLFIDSTSVEWSYLNVDTRTWNNVFDDEESKIIDIRIWYKSLPGDSWSYVEDAQILAGVVTARYFKVEINITDPAINLNSYVMEYSLKVYD